jgi:hypothetical protein
MIIAPEDHGWWIASDGLWYPPESHPDARVDAQVDALADADLDMAVEVEEPPADATSAAWVDMLATFPAFEATPRKASAVPSFVPVPATARRYRALLASVLGVLLALAACAVGVVASTGTSGPISTTGWTNHSLHVVGTPFAADGAVLLLDVGTDHDLALAAVDPANGSVKWSVPYSPSGITPGVQFGPVVVQNVALELAPAGSTKDAGVDLKGIDVQTGKVAWSLPQPVEATDPPQACNHGHDFCLPVWDTQTTTALVALDAVDGQPVFVVTGPYRNVSETAPGNANSGGLWQTSDSAPTFTWVDANGQRTWSQSVASVFGGSQYGPDNGYYFAYHGGLNVGSVGVDSTGDTTPLGESKTVGLRSADGVAVWSAPGSFMCGGALAFLATDLVCQYSGSAHADGQTTTVSGGLVLRGLDPATGALTWSETVGQANALSNGQKVAFVDGTHLVVQSRSGKRMVLDTENGSLAPVTASQVFWCEQEPLYKVNASSDGSLHGERASAPVFATCSASGARVDSRPTSRPPTVGVRVGGFFVWPSTDGLHAARMATAS